MPINLRDLTKDFFAGSLEGEDDDKRQLLNEACGCGTAPESRADLPQFINVDPIGGGPLGHRSGGVQGHDAVGDESVINELDTLSSALQAEGEGPLTPVVSALSRLLSSGQVDPTQLRQVWDTLFEIAQAGDSSES